MLLLHQNHARLEVKPFRISKFKMSFLFELYNILVLEGKIKAAMIP